MSTEKIITDISGLLPNRGLDINSNLENNRDALVQETAESIVRKKTAKELADIKLREKNKLKRMQEKLNAHSIDAEEVKEQEKLVEAVKTLEEQNSSQVPQLIRANMPTNITPQQAAALQATTRRDVVKLLTSLNINLNLQLTKNDTANLLACLLTCNETQLWALYGNKKVPIAIKTVIKRLLDDAKLGEMSTVEALWDRVFGKAGMILDLPQQQSQATGIIPGAPISREAYVVLRETIIK